jgi:hypothetical protein
VEHHEAVTTQVTSVGLDHNMGCSHGYGGVDGIPSTLQDFKADAAGYRIGRGCHSVVGDQGATSRDVFISAPTEVR